MEPLSPRSASFFLCLISLARDHAGTQTPSHSHFPLETPSHQPNLPWQAAVSCKNYISVLTYLSQADMASAASAAARDGAWWSIGSTSYV